MPLDSSQHEGLENHVQAAQLMLVEFATLVFSSILDVFRKPFVELVVRVEQTGHDEVQKRP